MPPANCALLPETVEFTTFSKAAPVESPRFASPPPTLDAVLEAVERNLIANALRRAGGNQTEAAAKLGIFRTRLGRRIEALKIETGS